jgi:hypothetical protein
MRIGYGRVSTRDQQPEAQRDALVLAGCEEMFIATASGKLARRPELDKALLSANRSGDQLVVSKPARLGRSLEHLIELSKQQIAAAFGVTAHHHRHLGRTLDAAAAAPRRYWRIGGGRSSHSSPAVGPVSPRAAA